MTARPAGLALIAATTLATLPTLATPARASEPPLQAPISAEPPPGDATAIDGAAVQAAAKRILASLDYRYQEQLTIVRGGRLPSGQLGLLELGAGVSFWSIGVAGALGFERVPAERLDSARDFAGGYAHLSAQWRPVALTHARLAGARVFHWVDPFVAVGTRLGGLRQGRDSLFRAALTLGAGIDIAWARNSAFHPVITLRYRADLLTAPTLPDERDHALGTPEHFILFGVGIRSAD